MSIPKWLKARPTRKAQMRACPICSAVLLVGLDADVAALMISVEYARLTGVGEVFALADGRVTFDVSWRSGHYELDPRDRRGIAKRPAATGVVVCEHRCGHRVPPHWRMARPVLQARRGKEIPDVPQF